MAGDELHWGDEIHWWTSTVYCTVSLLLDDSRVLTFCYSLISLLNILFCSNMQLFYKAINIKVSFYLVQSKRSAIICKKNLNNETFGSRIVDYNLGCRGQGKIEVLLGKLTEA